MRQFNDWAIEATARRGTDVMLSRHMDQFLRGVDLRQVTKREFFVPVGQYGGRIGQMMEINTYAFVDGFRGLALAAGITTAEAYDANTARLKQEIPVSRYALPYYIVYGQRAR